MSATAARLVLCVGVAGFCFSLSETAKAEGPYKFVRIADTKDAFSGFGATSARINNRGTVVFRADLAAGGRGLFTGDGTTLTTIATSGEEFADFDTEPDLNDQGRVFFWSRLAAGGERLVIGDGTTLNTIADTGPNSPFNGFSTIGGVAINNQGTVVFAAKAKDGGERLLTSDGKKFTELTTTVGTRFTGFLDANGPDINDAGVVVTTPQIEGGGEQVVVFRDGQVTSIADTTGSYATFAQASINNAGAIAFAATLRSGGQQLLIAAGGELKTIADSTGALTSFGGVPPGINNKGKVAFRPTLSPEAIGADRLQALGGEQRTLRGVFTGPDLAADKVIQVGDKLFGSIVTAVNFNRGINDAGQIGFYAELADGTKGIYRADPVAAANP